MFAGRPRPDGPGRQESYQLTQFKDLGLAEPILDALIKEGYENPTPIQAKAIPVVGSGRDMVGIAQTGTGKTAAFVLPLLNRLADSHPRPRPKSCGVLILTPTRELAAQIAEAIGVYGRALKPTVAVVIGGTSARPQIRAMAPGVDFLVATPGRLLDHMSEGAISLRETKTVVLDEADQMLDLGFMPAIRKIMANLPGKRQTLLFSATMPKQIRALADDFLDNPEEIAVSPVSRPIDRIDQKVVHVDKAGKTRLLETLLRDETVERAVVFTRTKHGADKVCRPLEKSGLGAAAIHGNKSQGNREKTMASFRAGKLSILVATDIAARGIDIDDVSHVYNYDLPHVPEVYVHRIGRTARAGKSGFAVSFCDAEERPLLRDIEKLTGMTLAVANSDVGLAMPALAAPVRAGGKPQEKNAGANQKPKRNRSRRRNGGGGGKVEGFRPAANANAREGGKRVQGGADAGLNRMLGNIGRNR